MSLSLDKAMGILPEAVNVRAKRMELLASNIANADTPNYKARDIDFRSVLQAAAGEGGNMPMASTHQGHIGAGGAGGANGSMETLYRVPSQPSLDGNTVDPQLERAAFAENSLQYQSSLEFLNRRVSGIRDALRGER
ncbi:MULTISPECIES: flagellar basal body rod protein FlgB [unclassified Thioalkalivibrio]|uniref:flagellar basal body rod protein FlgB n=1 Tax=unclassified Thioalkalivibrio TaxID=2621013 RepID=UPI000195AA32|nr:MULTISPECIES: flagellar basal body rod protein FlgB [unclassified Thioalkalivibrio]ADC71441.1 flagellar basal-body rod protein FlgB [Thioalkalivibrio sp. K90mix]